MRKIKIAITILAVVAFLGIVSTATAAMLIPVSDQAKERAKAPENSPVIDENWDLERVDFIHYAKPENPGKLPKAPACYKLLGPKWKFLPVNYVINPTGSGLTNDFVTTAVSISAEEWDGRAGAELFSDTYTVSANVNYGAQDFVNAISFGDYPDDRVIAVTTVWWSPRGRQIVEFDVMFDTDFVWGDAMGNSTVMDLQNIATHELGHGAGLDDVYETACVEVTMYGYSDYGETKKRILEPADVTGIQELYGK